MALDVKIPIVRALLAKPYLDALEARGIPLGPVLSKSGLQRIDLSEAFAQIPLTSFLTFTHQVADALGNPCAGLSIGAAQRADLGPIARHLFTLAQSLREAISIFCEAVIGFQEQTNVRLTSSGRNWCIDYRIENVDIELARHDTEYSLAMLCRLIRRRVGDDWKPIEIHFEHHSPPHTQQMYERLFQSRVLFGQPINRILMPPDHLDDCVPYLGGTIVDLLQQHLYALRHDMEQSRTVSHRVSQLISKHLGSEDFGVATIAPKMNMSVRTMQRKLAEEGTSFKQLVRRQRQRLATTLIRSGKATTMAEIAATLGYADQTAWSRAFKSWVGIPPGQYSRASRDQAHQSHRH